MKWKQSFVCIGLTVTIAAMVVFCLKEPVQDPQVVTIGGAFALTGFAAEWGTDDRNGVLLAIEEANMRSRKSYTYQLIAEDTETNNAKSLSVVQKLIHVDGANYIVGPTWLDSFHAPLPIFQDEHVVAITPSGAVTSFQGGSPYDYVYSTWFRTDKQVRQLVSYLKGQGVTRLVLLYPNDSFWVDTMSHVRDQARKEGVEIVFDQQFQGEDTDVRTHVAKLKALEVDAIFFGAAGDRQSLTLLKQIKELGIQAPLYTTEWVASLVGQKEYVGLFDTLSFVVPEVSIGDFNKKYEGRFGTRPVFSAQNAYDATNMLITAIETVGNNPVLVNEYLKHATFDTVTFGKMAFDSIGGVEGGTFVVQKVIDGAATEVAKLE